jgi:hypothetical protein
MISRTLRLVWRRAVAILGGERRRLRRARARLESKTRLADELLATLSPQALFMAGYPADRRAWAYRRRVTYARIRHVPVIDHRSLPR